MNNNKLRTISAAILAIWCTSAHSEQPLGPYVGILMGGTGISRDVTEDYTYHADKFGWGAVLGWQAHPNLAVEAGYFRPNGIRESGSDGVDTAEVTAKFHGWTASALATWPLSDRLSAHVRVGAVRATEKYTATVNGDFAGSYSDNVTDVLYGAGLGVMVEGARVRLDYQRAEFRYGKFSFLSLGINWFLPTAR